MNAMLHRLLRKDPAKDQKPGPKRRETTGCGGSVLLALILAAAAALITLLNA